MDELEINGNAYVIGKLTSREQRRIAKRLAPLLLASKDMIAQLFKIASSGQQFANVGEMIAIDLSGMADAATPLVGALSAMPDEDLDCLIEISLGAVRRKTASGYQGLMVQGELRFQDINMLQQIQLAAAVIRQNMGDFMPALPGNSSGA